MMGLLDSIREVAFKDISSGLTQFAAHLQSDNADYERAQQACSIVLTGPFSTTERAPAALRSYIEQLARLAPARIIVVQFTENNEMQCAIALANQSTKGGLLSEVIFLAVPPHLLSSLESTIYSLHLPGTPQRLFLRGDGFDLRYLKALVPLVHEVIFDSLDFASHLDDLAVLIKPHLRLCDLQWISLANWRDQIKSLFDLQGASSLIHNLSSITLTYSGADNHSSGPNAAAFLLTGWLVSCLRLEVCALGHQGFECRRTHESSAPASITVSLNSKTGISELPLLALSLQAQEKGRIECQLEATQTGKTATETPYSLRAYAQFIDAQGNPFPDIIQLRPYEIDPTAKRLEQLFLMGDSMGHYREALAFALEMRRLYEEFFRA
jgi:glucose-6-phosphate dehydrogenase assembly protein OpcA